MIPFSAKALDKYREFFGSNKKQILFQMELPSGSESAPFRPRLGPHYAARVIRLFIMRDFDPR